MHTCGGVFCLSEFFVMAFSARIDLFCVKFFVEDQQQFVHWKRPLVRIPLMVDMVVCTLLQSEPTKMLKYAFALLQCCHVISSKARFV
ncbi:hypothetical protein T01_5015 [Trichinella spiralis]|uniref:Secreted protein n=1 Tax=Trichinella spiralis TaxID=6334 RepID=A0A0V1AUG8_TRISP|nr:hypothetical protein T01_5015 [Trichinella spiralis]